jgi:CRP-like cAMP-binding protein
MTPAHYLKQYFNARSPLSEEEWNFISDRFRPVHCRKGELLLTPGKTCTYVGFNPDGIFRIYALDEKGNEKNFLFQLEGSFVTDYESFISQRPSRYYIECLQEATLVTLDYSSAVRIYETIPPFQKIGRLVAEELYVLAKNRVEDFMLLSAGERYLKLISQHPEIFGKIPLGYIAEYLNMRPQSLSRIRKRISTHG